MPHSPLIPCLFIFKSAHRPAQSCKGYVTAPHTADDLHGAAHCEPHQRLGRLACHLSYPSRRVRLDRRIEVQDPDRQHNGIEPYAYLCHLFEEFPRAKTAEQLEALLPWNAKATLDAAAAQSDAELAAYMPSDGGDPADDATTMRVTPPKRIRSFFRSRSVSFTRSASHAC